MPRKATERSKTNFYHITARSNNKEFFYLPILNVWDIMTKKLSSLQSRYDIKIAAFVLMNNHFHLLLLTPNEDIDRVMYFFMKEVTLEIQKGAGRINKIFGGRYKGSMIDSYDYLLNVYKYIYRNPIEVGLCDRAEQYLYSTLFYQHQASVRSPFHLESIIPESTFNSYEDLDKLKWINQRFAKHEADSISCGLRKTIFAYGKNRNTGRPIEPAINHP
jgi:putative transposase